jgi:hypothetical protein
MLSTEPVDRFAISELRAVPLAQQRTGARVQLTLRSRPPPLLLKMIRATGVDIYARSFFNAAKACVGVTRDAVTMARVARGNQRGHH